MPDTININDSKETVKNKIIAILDFQGISTAGITTWGIATIRLNEAATSLNLPTISDGDAGNNARTKINAIASSDVASAPSNVSLPVISGLARTGETLTTSNGTWDGVPSPTFGYQWKRDGVDISGATSNSFLVTDDEAGLQITVTVTATNPSGSSNATSNPTEVSQPSWAPISSVFAADLLENKYWEAQSPVCVRNSVGYALDSFGIWKQFGINTLRLTDVGLLTEASRTGTLLWSMNLSNVAWLLESGLSRSTASGTPIEGQTPTRFTWSTGNGRVSQSTTYTASNTYTFQAIVKGTTAARYACFRSSLVGVDANAYHNAVFDLTNGTVEYRSPNFSSSRMTALGDGWWFIEAEGVALASGNRTNYLYVCNNPIPSNSFVPPTSGMDYYDVAYFNVLNDSGSSSPIESGSMSITTREADIVTMDVDPVGIHDLHLILSNDSEKTVAGWESGDQISVPDVQGNYVKFIFGT